MDGGFLPDSDAPARRQAPPHPTQPQPPRARAAAEPPAAPPGGAAAPPRPPPRGCTDCGAPAFDASWHEAFGVALCPECRRAERLVTGTAAKARFGVTDGDLRRLGRLRKANPRQAAWQPMALYLESQVEELARRRHGGAPGGDPAERQRALLDARLAAKLKRREDEAARRDAGEAALRRARRRVAGLDAPAAAAPLGDDEVEEL